MVGSLIDDQVRKFIFALYTKGGHVSRSIVATTAKVLLSRTQDESLKNLAVTNVWGKSFLKRMGF